MSNDKTTSPQYTQHNPTRPQADTLDDQYKPIGISAVTAALQPSHHPAPKKSSGEQMG